MKQATKTNDGRPPISRTTDYALAKALVVAVDAGIISGQLIRQLRQECLEAQMPMHVESDEMLQGGKLLRQRANLLESFSEHLAALLEEKAGSDATANREDS